MKTFKDIKEFNGRTRPKAWEHMTEVDVKEDKMDNLTITFRDGKSLFYQSDYDIDVVIDSMAYVEAWNSYYIYDAFYDIVSDDN